MVELHFPGNAFIYLFIEFLEEILTKNSLEY